MKVKLAYLILPGVILLGGLLFLFLSKNKVPAAPAGPKGTETNSTATENLAPSTPLKETSEVGPTSPQSSTTEKGPTPGTSTGTIPAVTSTPGQKPGTTQETTTPTSPIPIQPTVLLTEGLVGKTPTPPGRLSPDYLAAPLKFTQIRIFMNDAGVFSGIANVSNTGETFLNALVIQWRIVDRGGNLLDQGQISWPNLAPGETATIAFTGTTPFNDLWDRVTFEFQP